MNDRQEAGMSAQADQIRVVTAAIQALGALGVKAALPELIRTQTIATWSSSVLREAKAASLAAAASK
jgi:hypothetical protein